MDLFTKLQPKGWLGKQGLIVPPSVRTAIAEPQGWLESMSLFRDVMRSDTPLPSIKGVLEGTKNLNDKVKNSALQLCETAYSINRSYNSKESNLLTKATKLEGKIKPTKTDSLTASSIELCSSMFLDLPGIKSGNHPGYNLGNIEFEMAQMEQANRSWLHSLLLEAEAQLEILAGKARVVVKRLSTRIKKLLGIQPGAFQQAFIEFYQEEYPIVMGFVPAPLTPVSQVISGVGGMGVSLLDDLVFKAVAVPPAFTTASSSAIASIVLKNVRASGADVVRYQAANLLRSLPSAVPAVWNSTGMFAGAWTSLMAAAPYLIIAGVIITAAIEITRDCEVGDEYICVAYEDFKLRAYSFTVVGLEKKEERLKYFQTIKDAIINGQEGKVLQFTNLYIFTREKGNVKLSVDFTGPMIPWSKEQTAVNWASLCTQCRWLVDDDVPPFPVFEP